jgi:acyl carrier protein
MEAFIKHFAATFENPGKLLPDTEFRTLDEWSSLNAMLTLAMIQDEYGVTLDPDRLKDMHTIQDIYDAVQA